MRFLLIGGYAVILLGYVRATVDCDLLVPHSERDRWKVLFESIGYSPFAETSGFVQLHPPPGKPVVDVMVVSDETFAKLTVGSLEKELEQCRLRIPSPQSMVALKLHASRQRPDSGSRDKDLTDVIEIIKRNELSLDNPEFHELVLRYGGPDAIGFIKLRTHKQAD